MLQKKINQRPIKKKKKLQDKGTRSAKMQSYFWVLGLILAALYTILYSLYYNKHNVFFNNTS